MLPAAYGNAAEFMSRSLLVQDSLQSHRGERLARTYVVSLIRKVRTFGFHLHTLDIRQHARIHKRVIEELGPASRARAPTPPRAGNCWKLFAPSRKLKRTHPAEFHSALHHQRRGI